MNLKYQPWQYVWVLWTGLACFAGSVLLVSLGLASAWWLLGTWLVYSFMAMTNSAGFHRLFAHGSYETSPFWEWFLLLTGTLSCYGSSFQWAVVHTQHHKHADTDRDPHRFGSWKQVFSTNYVIDEVSFASRRAIKRLMHRPGHRWIHGVYWLLPLSFATALLLLFGPPTLLFLYLAPLGLVIFSAAVFNRISHADGAPINQAFYALQSSGEWRHKLHHDEPWRWNLAERWYHVDPAGIFISLIRRVR